MRGLRARMAQIISLIRQAAQGDHGGMAWQPRPPARHVGRAHCPHARVAAWGGACQLLVVMTAQPGGIWVVEGRPKGSTLALCGRPLG